MASNSPFTSEPRKVEMSELDLFISQGRMPTLPAPQKSEASNDFANSNHN